MTKSSSLETKSATQQQQKEAHHAFDLLWQATAFSKQHKKTLRSRIYQLWASVRMVADQSTDVSGIIDPFAGTHHIKDLKEKDYELLKEFVRHILFDQNDGNTRKLAASLVKWFSPLHEIIAGSLADQVKVAEIGEHIGSDPMVLKICEYLAEFKLKSEAAKKLRENSESDSENSEPESDQPPVNIKLSKLKEPKPPQVQDIFLDALMADIEGNETKAQELYKQAEDMGYEEKKDREQKSENVRSSLQNNILDSIYVIGVLFYKQHSKEMIKYVQKMAGLGSACAQGDLGVYHRIGKYGITQDDKEAVRLFKLAAEQGNATAQYNLGSRYFDGIGVDKDVKEAVRLYRLAAEQGMPNAQFNLGLCYLNGTHVAKNAKEAVRLFRLAAEQGNSDAQFNYGACYMNGTEVAKNAKEAVKWFELSANQSNSNALFELGVCYLNGTGVNKNEKEAVKLFRLAADQGNSKAQANLGVCYLGGTGVDKDEKEAVRLFTLAAKDGNSNAQTQLGVCYLKGNGVDKNEVYKNKKEAIRWLESAVEKGDSNAQYNLGLCYCNGMAVNKNVKEAARLFELAAAQQDNEASNVDARYNLGVIHHSGAKDIEKNYSVAEKYFELVKDTEKYSENIKKVLPNIKKHAAIEKKIEANIVLINKLTGPENKDVGKIINPKILEIIKKSYEECKQHIEKTGVKFRSEIITQYNSAGDFLKAQEKLSSSTSTAPKPISGASLQQNNLGVMSSLK